nr:Unknown Function [uncultured bacterium]
MSSSPQNSSQYLDVRFGSLLPWPFHFMAVIVLLISIGMITTHPWIASIFTLACLFVFTAAEGTEIDLQKKAFREYTSIYFVKTGGWVGFDTIEKVYVNRNKVRQNMNPSRTGLTRSVTFMQFSAFVKFNEEEIVELIKHRNKDVVMKKAKAWAEQLNVALYDNASEE